MFLSFPFSFRLSRIVAQLVEPLIVDQKVANSNFVGPAKAEAVKENGCEEYPQRSLRDPSKRYSL